VIYSVGPVQDCSAFREAVKHEHGFREAVKHEHGFLEDRKQAIVDEIMAQLERLHEAAEKDRLSS
jgi:glycerol-3-phosphate O-acyltransferase